MKSTIYCGILILAIGSGPMLSAEDVSTQTSATASSQRTLNNGNLVLQNVPEIPQQLVTDLNRFQNIRGAALRGWLPDSSGIYISTRFADVSQLHRVTAPGGHRYQLTFFKEPIGGINPGPDGNLLTFLMDAGGNEAGQIFTLDPVSGEHRMISDGESRNGGVLWHPDGKQIAFRSTRRNGASNDVWMMNIDDPESAKVIWESPDGTSWGAADFSPDGKRLLIQQYVSAADSRVFLLDLETGKRRQIAGDANNPARNFGGEGCFSPNGDGVYLVTDRAGDFAQLAFQPLTSDGEPAGDAEIITADIQWDLEDVTFSHDRSRAAIIVNEGGLSRLYLFDPASRGYQAVKGIPIGVVGSLRFSPDGRRLGMTLNTSTTPSDVFVLELGESPLEHGELTRWTFSEVGGLNTDRFAQPQLVKYPTFDQSKNNQPREVPAFVYKPAGDGPFPVIISIHGGPEGQFRPYFSSRFQIWANQLGAAVIAPNVRGSAGYGAEYLSLDNGFKREDSVKDIGALLDWIGTQPDLDADRVAVYGGSYGGYMVLACATHYSDRLKAAVDVVGISNFVTFLKNTKDYRRDLRRVEYGDERDPAMNKFLEEISPTNHVDRIKIPMLVIQGQNDPRVPVTEAEQIVKALEDQGSPVWYINALNEGHGFRKKENRDVSTQATIMFLRQFLVDG